MDSDEFMRLQTLGATARAAGRSPFDNPFYLTAGMPAMTGEIIRAWEARAAAWSLGFTGEDAMRSGRESPSYPAISG